eukprot:TRINITY_DN90435_c0_g1_i1.p1 TRINITY_DN90435_c0_g1~~TRINITY_DN90435_c0_g1_i1.p1  ORF type:complete len:317 (+),score=42.33 TRINITY_DN90435_c0_g1_i1:105-1055(+)
MPKPSDVTTGGSSSSTSRPEVYGYNSEATVPVPGRFTSSIYRMTYTGWGELVKCMCCPLFSCNLGPVVVVDQGWVGVTTRFGVFETTLGPGLYVLNPATQAVQKVCMKMQTFEIPRQAAMTRDNLSVQVDAVTFVTVVDPFLALFHVEDYHRAVKTLAASTLLRVIGEHDLQDMFHDRAKINDAMTRIMQDKTSGWGLKVASVEMRDITIAETMQRAMAQIAEANREAQSKVIVAEGQRKAAFVFAQASDAMEQHPMALQLQWFETLRQIAAEKNSTVIVPDSVIGSLSGLVAPRLEPSTGAGPVTGRGVAETKSQ